MHTTQNEVESRKGQVIKLQFLRQLKQNRMIAYLMNVTACTFSDSAYARLHAKRNAVIQILVATAAFILMVRIYPMGLVQNHNLSKQKAYHHTAKEKLSGDPFTAADKKLQTIYFNNTHLYQIKLYMSCTIDKESAGAERILFRLYDENFSCVYEEDIDSRTIEKKGFLVATPDLDVEQERAYYYEILIPEESTAVYQLPVAPRSELAQMENSSLYIDGIINDDVCLIADFDYTSPLSLARILFYDLRILFITGILYFLINFAVVLYDDRFTAQNTTIRKYFCVGVSALILLLALFLLFYAVIQNKFGGEIWDRMFFFAGIAAAAFWSAAAVWLLVFGTKKRNQRVSVGQHFSLIWRNYIQIVSFGLLFYALCQYVNADRNLYHTTNTRWMLIFLAIALLMNYNEKQFVHIINGAWIVVALVGSVVYCRKFEPGTNELLVAKLTCAAVLAWGVLLITIGKNFKLSKNLSLDKMVHAIKKYKLRTIYFALWILFSILMYMNRFEKVWVFTATLPFLAVFFIKMPGAAQSRFLINFTNGILVSFGLVMLFCLHHRPHHYWMLYRYGGIFHTVACTGMYLAVVFGAAFAKLYGKLRDKKNMFLRCFFEYLVTACVVGCILLTMSRTAFLTTSVTVVAIMALTAVAHHKHAKRILSELGVFALVCLLNFPMVYTTIRMVPAVVGDPIRYDIEFQDEDFMVYKGDPIDSDKYMTVRRFFNTLFGRFQTEEAKEETAQIQKETQQEEVLLAYTGDNFKNMGISTVSADSDEDIESEEEKKDISNGRFRIFQDYIGEISIKGHPKMGPLDEKGSEYAHAHNSYLQVAYNFGMIAGVVFLVLCGLTLWEAVRLFIRDGRKYSILLVPFALVVVFGFVSLTEWAYHPCIPAGFCFILMKVFLMKDCQSEKTSKAAKGTAKK